MAVPTTSSIQTPTSRASLGPRQERGIKGSWSQRRGALSTSGLPTCRPPVPSPPEKDSLISGQTPLPREGWTLSVSDAETWSGPQGHGDSSLPAHPESLGAALSTPQTLTEAALQLCAHTASVGFTQR